MTSQEAKIELLWYWLFRRNAAIAATEVTIQFGIADVFVLDDAMLATEIEVKVSRADLRMELNAIKILDQDLFDNTQIKNTKQNKHYVYLKQNSREIPNKFYFAVPTILVEFARAGILNTPYGLLEVTEGGNVLSRVRAKKLHAELFRNQLQIMRKLSTESYLLRRKNLSLIKNTNGKNV